jgi:hypothetical protein
MKSMKSYLLLFLLFISVFVFTAGGRVASSDETAFFLEAQSVVESGTMAIPEGIVDNGAHGRDGRFYVGGGIGFTGVALPFYLLGKLAVNVLPIPETYSVFVLKGFFSLTNQFLCAALGILFFSFCRKLKYSDKLAFFLTSAFLFSTNLFPYAKSAMREPLITLCLLGTVYSLWLFKARRENKFLYYAGASFFYLLITKWSFIVLLPCLAWYWIVIFDDTCFADSKNIFRKLRNMCLQKMFLHQTIIILSWLAAAAVVTGIYNWIQFGSACASGYTQRPQPFTNPLWVGIYGLLFSSGKSFFLYAPVTVLVFWSATAFYRQYKNEMILFIMIFLVMLIFHAKYFAWAGDGSWGPRYLIPVIPYFIIPLGILFQNTLEQRKKIYKLAAILLSAAGLIIQLGGCSIYLGSYLRFIGEYPFRNSFSDPEFMHRSHFIPNYSPVVGHWKLLVLAVEKHVQGDIGPITIADAQQRIPISEADRPKLVYLIDYWFMYAYYAGIRTIWILFSMSAGLAAVIYLGRKNYTRFCKNGN